MAYRVLDRVGLTAEQKALRTESIGGSDATIICGGDPERIERLRLEKLGRIEPEDLNRVVPVVLGQHTEPLNLDFYEHTTGRKVTREGERAISPVHPWRTCTLDGMDMEMAAPVQAKHVNAFAKLDEVVQKYMPQMHHEMDCTETARAFLTVFHGTLKWEYFEIECDASYAKAVFELEAKFWECVQLDQPWPGLPAPVVPVAPDALRTVDMNGSNEWGAVAADWLENGAAAKKFEKAAKGLKGLVEIDVGKAFGAGIEINRAKGGSLRIKEMNG